MVDIGKVLVVGSGTMGSQIAAICGLAGIDVAVHDVDPDRLTSARNSLADRLAREVDKGRVSEEDRASALGRMTFGTDLAALCADADFVIEAAVEKIEVKRNIFAQLDQMCPAHTFLVSNSSSFMPSRLADATARADRVCNMHFFNPALVMKCVEVVRSAATSEATCSATVALAERLGKHAVVLNKEISGFVANRILNAIRDEAVFLFENEYASLEAIDTACRTALGHPMGPFELQDLTGLDIAYYTKQARYEETGDPADKPSRSLAERVEVGWLGRKSGQGWYCYDADGNRTAGV